MSKLFRNKHLHFVVLWIFAASTVFAQIPNGYYNNATDKSGAELKTALHNIIHTHTELSYTAMPTYFAIADWHPDGYFWDMYSNEHYTTWSGSGMNREHNMPKSWFGVAGGKENSHPMGCDLHNLYPSNAKANQAKGNLPLGEVTGAISYENGVVKIGKTTYYKAHNYNGNVFEPADEYKGDFARDYMYMVTCYENEVSRWTSIGTQTMLNNTYYPTLEKEAISLLLKWHTQDPVSEKEIDRNDAVYSLQGNRNPFIDHPEYAESIWNNKTSKDEVKHITFLVSYFAQNKAIKLWLNNAADSKYVIYNVSGEKMLVDTLNEDALVSVSQLPQGLYIVIVYDQKTQFRRVGKFVLTENA